MNGSMRLVAVAGCIVIGVEALTATPLHAQTLAPGPASVASAPKVAHADAGFMKDAAEAGSAEIEAAHLAQTKATQAATKTFAQQMIDDHTKLATALQQLATSKQVDLPSGPSVAQKSKLKLIDMGDDAKFDARYAKNFGVDAHKDAVKLFQKASTQAKDPDVKAFALQNLPSLQHHLEMAQELLRADMAAEKQSQASKP